MDLNLQLSMRGAAIPAWQAWAGSGSAASAGISHGCAILALRDSAIIDDLEAAARVRRSLAKCDILFEDSLSDDKLRNLSAGFCVQRALAR
jgi:hypothetical protein